MANTLRFKRGLASGIPTALAGEPLFTTDTFDLYIGNGTTNTRFQKYIASGATTQILRGDGSLYTFPLAISSPSNGQVLKYNGTSWVNDSDAGITGSGSAGQVAYFTGATTQGGNNALFWDTTNLRLGIGTNTPNSKLEVYSATGYNFIRSVGLLGSYFESYSTTGVRSGSFGSEANGDTYAGSRSNNPFILISNATERARIFATGNFGIGTGASDSGQLLQVTGTMKVTGASTIGGILTVSVNGSTIGTNGAGGYGLIVNSSSGGNAIKLIGRNNSPNDEAFLEFFKYDGTTRQGYVAMVANAMLFASNNTLNMTLDASGNLGLGVTPSAWFTANSLRALQTTNGATLVGALLGGEFATVISNNWFANSSGANAYIANGVATQYVQISGQHRWLNAASGTAGNAITFTQAMTLDASGNLGVGVTNADPFSRGYTRMLGLSTTTSSGSTAIQLNGGSGGYAQIDFGAGGTRTAGISGSANETQWGSLTAIPAIIYTNSSEKMRITSGGNTILAYSGSDSGEKLQVNGTAKITGASTFGASIIASGLISSATEFRLNNQAFSKIAILDAGGGFAGGYNFNLSGSTPQHSLTGAISGVYYGSGGTINFYTGTSQTAGTTATSRMSLDASGNLYVDTNTLFVDATNNRVGVLTTTPSEPLHVAGNMLISGANSFKMRNLAGTDVNVIRAVSGGTSVLSTATLGNNIAIGTQSAHDFLLCSSDTERIRLSSSGWFSHTNATNPSASVTDSYVQYSADVTAGNAAPHFRTENGAVIKLYQETTAVGNSTISVGGGNAVLDDTEFGGYTLRQVVKALQNQGILA